MTHVAICAGRLSLTVDTVRYDIAGRVFQGVPAPLNMVIPPYKFVNDTQIMIGTNPEWQS